MTEITEDDYYATLDDNLQHGIGGSGTGAYDLVADQTEYARFRRALMRWVAEQDAEWDEVARNEEMGVEL